MEEALNSPEIKEWNEARQHGLFIIDNLYSYHPALLPTHKKKIRNKRFFSKNRIKEGQVTRYRSLICKKGFTKVPEMDFNELFARLEKYSKLRCRVALIALRRFKIIQIDAENVFLFHMNQQKDGNFFLLLKSMKGLE